jgi:hypothetical protein
MTSPWSEEDRTLSARLYFERDRFTGAAFADLTRRWLSDGLPQLGEPMWTDLQQRTIMPVDMPPGPGMYPGAPVGESGDVWCDFNADAIQAVPEQWEWRLADAYSPDGFAEFLDQLGEPDTAGVYLYRLTRGIGGIPGRQTAVSFEVETYKAGGSTWTVLSFDAARSLWSHDRQQAFLQFLRRFADATNPAYGEISNALGHQSSLLEWALLIGPDDQRPRETLRGYSWLTVLPQELGDRLGGQPALAATGAFHTVVSLPQGGYWLQATPNLHLYDLAAASRIWEVLRPVLPAGQPRPIWPDPENPTDLLVQKDALGDT